MNNTASGKALCAIVACAIILSMLGSLPNVVRAASAFNIGDTVRVTTNLNVRTGPSTSNPEITDPDYPGYAPAGTQGKVLDGPVSADGYVWWKVDYGPGLYSGWSVEGGLQKLVQPPPAPTITSPGSSSEPGTVLSTLTPTLQWNAVSGAGVDYYALAISKYPYGSGNIIYNPQQVTGTSHVVPGGTLVAGEKYRWNMQAHNSAGWSAVSNTLYFQTQTTTYTLTMSIQGQGTVSPSGGSYASGTQVTITANPASGWQFSDWSGDLSGSQNPATITMNSNKNITATFAQQVSPSPAPVIISPGSGSEPGTVLSTLTPTLQWNAVSGAGVDYYALAISKYPYGSGNIIYNPQQVTGTSHVVPGGTLVAGEKYRWNMQAHNSAGWSAVSNTLYFQAPPPAQQPPPAGALEVTSNPATEIGISRAILNGNLNSTGGLNSQVWFEYGLTSSYGYATPEQSLSSPALFERIIAGLTPGTTYHFRAAASNSNGTTYGEDMTLVTLAESSTPQVTTGTADEVSSTGAVLNGYLISTGGINCQVRFEYGTSTSYGTFTSGQDASFTGQFNATISGLTPGTTYHFRAIAANSEGNNFGPDTTFTTGTVNNVTLTLYVHENSTDGPAISGATVTGQDGSGSSFSQMTNSNGFVTITGTPGIWSFTASKSDYNTNTWSESITSITTKDTYLIKQTEIGQVILTQPVQITPPEPYSVGDYLTATFTVKNISDAAITLDKLLLGGRFNGGELLTGGYPDFTSRSVTLQPGESHQYDGTLVLTEPGNYHFFVAYYMENPTEAEKEFLDENNWNTSIELGEGLSDADRIRDIATGVDFDFSLSISPISGEVARDETVSTTVIATITGGTTQPVSFSVTGLPSGVSANALASDSPTISRTLTFTATSNAVLGTHTITITATGGGINRTTTYILTVKELITPQITGVNPAQPIAQPTRQWLGILGTGFVTDSQVILRIGLSEYPIPTDRTEYVDSNRINVFVGLTVSGTWTAQVVNPSDRQSNIFSFTVAAQDKNGLNVAAEVAVMLWEPDIAVTMVAIAGAESGWILDAGGDSPSILQELGYEESANRAKTYNCPLGSEYGYASWGLWQIFMPEHKAKLAGLGAPKDDPCSTAEWLRDPVNNAKAAYAVWEVQGFDAWAAYKDGEYEDYLPDARQAVEQATLVATQELAAKFEKTLKISFIADIGWPDIPIPPIETGYAQITVSYEQMGNENPFLVQEISYEYKGDLWGFSTIEIRTPTGERLWFHRISITGSKQLTFYPKVKVSSEDIIALFITGRPGPSWLDLIPLDIIDPIDLLQKAVGQRATRSMTFDPFDVPGDPFREYLETEYGELIYLLSPGELRVYDSQGHVTGLVEGELKQEIPDSISAGNIVLIFDATDSYRYEVVGTDEGTYGINIASVREGEVTNVGVTDVITSERVVHRYTINWDALRRGEPSIGVQIDSDGDNTFEQTKILQPPIASFILSPINAVTDEEIDFHASESHDVDGEILSYKWNFGDGTASTGRLVTHTYSAPGEYIVTLAVVDNDGVVSTHSEVIQVKQRQGVLPVWVLWILIGTIIALAMAFIVLRRMGKKQTA